MRLLSILVLASLTVGCQGRRIASPPPDELLGPHAFDARGPAARAEPEARTDLPAFEERLAAIRASWDEKLRSPAALATFHAFTTPDMARLLEEAASPDFAASLAEGVTVDRILAGAFLRNPELQAARRRLRGTIEQYAQVTYLDDTLGQYAAFLRSLDTKVRPAPGRDPIGRHFPFPGVLELKAALVRHAVEEARARQEIVLRDLVTDVRTAYAAYVFAGEAIRNTEETLTFLRQLEETARGKLAAGSTQKTHVIQIQVQISQLENDLLTLGREQDTLRARLNTSLDLAPASPLGAPAPPPLPPFPTDVAGLTARAMDAQPEIQVARARASRMAAMIELAEQSAYPPLSPGLSAMEGISHETGGSAKEREPFPATARVAPDPWFGGKDAYLREAREGERAARLRVTAARDRTAFRVTEAHNRLDTAQRLHELYRDVQLAQARQAYEDAASGYAADRVAFMDVIDALRQWLRFRLDDDRAVRDYRQAYARLESAVGRSIRARD